LHIKKHDLTGVIAVEPTHLSDNFNRLSYSG
jgi:hypothetical protein